MTGIKAAKASIAVMAVIAAGVVIAYMDSVTFRRSGGELSPVERKAIEEVIRDYLLKNPGIIADAMVALRVQQDTEKRARVNDALKKYSADLLQDADSPEAGNPRGDIVVVEFFDYNCGYCKKAAGALAALAARDPNVRIVYKEFAILGPQSVMAAKAALAAQRQGKYGEFHQGLMAARQLDDPTIKALAVNLGLNYAVLAKDMKDSKLGEQIDRVHQLAGKIGIAGTPAFIVGERLVPGAVDAEALVFIVNEERVRLLGEGTQTVPAK